MRWTFAATPFVLLLAVLACPPLRQASAEKPIANAAPSPTVRTDVATGLELVPIPGGRFHFGCEPRDIDCSGDERPGHTAEVASMWLGKTEVTVAAYARCVAAGSCSAPNTGGACTWGVPSLESHPVNCVDWAQASSFCQHMGGRLPTAEEWEYAAKSGQDWIYPWGDDPPNDRRANFADLQFKKKYPRAFDVPGQDDGWIETAPAGSFPDGASKQGALDLVGNVIEWTSSEYLPEQMEARGGGWGTDTVSRRLRASYRTGRPRSFWHATFGFRCRLPGAQG